MKSSKAYRVLALDHGLLSFVDTQVGAPDEWPLLLPTNPKDARFLSVSEPLRQIVDSTHVRCAVFSPAAVASVSVSIDGEPALLMARAEAVRNSTAWPLQVRRPFPILSDVRRPLTDCVAAN